MNLVEMMPHQLTYWPPASPDGFGQVVFGAPVFPVACRWQDTQKIFRDASGQEVMSEAIVYLETDLALNGYVVLGDQSAESDPRNLDAAREIRQTNSSASLDGDQALRKVWL